MQHAPIKPLQRCQIEPLPQRQFSFRIDGSECTRWHFGGDAPRPFFYPIVGPSGVSLTRMGHPGAPNHDHHRSFWFAHHDLLGASYWTEETPARIEQSQWYAIEDGDEFARIAFELLWRDGHDPTPVLKQDVFVTIRPQPSLGEGAWSLELQCDFKAEAEGVEFAQSNFGVLGLRVAKSLSVVFGAGKITGASGGVDEKDLFGRPNRWVDYSGPVGLNAAGEAVREGLTLIDHAGNPGHGSDAWASWHVRNDGWIGPSLTRSGPLLIAPGSPVTCRYALLVHAADCQPSAVDALADVFDARSLLRVQKGTSSHVQWEIAG
ncbi:MAG: PmoA family protein [Pirellulaceae bacterium]